MRALLTSRDFWRAVIAVTVPFGWLLFLVPPAAWRQLAVVLDAAHGRLRALVA